MDFNACRSVVVAGNSGQYILKPVLNLTDDEESGSISGYLPPAEAGAVVMAEDSQGHILKTTVAAAASGNSGAASFTLSPLPASSKGYDVVITPPAPSDAGRPSPNFTPDVVLGVPVGVGQTTSLGSATTPLPVTGSTQDAFYTGTIYLPSPADTLVVAQVDLNSTTTISIAQGNGTESSSATTQIYAMELPTASPAVANYSASSLNFTQATSAPTISISAYDSAGATGSTMIMTHASFALSGRGDDTFYADH